MRLQNTIESQGETKRLLEENLKISKATLKAVEKTRKYIFWNQILNWLKLILIIAPIIFAILYLPPLIEKLQEQVKTIFPFGNIGGIEQFQGAEELLEKLQK